jgi:hypothetical protein
MIGNQGVVGSNPTAGTKHFNNLDEVSHKVPPEFGRLGFTGASDVG